ncbi:hypothetical protein Dsin_002413 [Dipteronia sinensis]|uniref:HAT C-terminal dimerisation domain-containing protein n=1 Tax=Dipteronia sinensis TaxID=43782 RepID=A0AAE0B723_9ROSI|nr:hypothetical protein Dsin_002413 [Dipteronia sinensis]
MMNKVIGYTNLLCQALQIKTQDILNAMRFVSTTKSLLQKFREDGWDTFIQSVTTFCDKHHIDIPDLSAQYKEGTIRSCQQHDCITIEHYYNFSIFNAVIDFQMVELDDRFPERTIELLIFSSSLDPSDSFKSFHIDNICNLAEKFYPQDFSGSEIDTLRRQLEHYELDVPNDSQFQNISSLLELCPKLYETKRSEHFHLIDRLIRLVLTLHVSTATTKRVFSAMKLIKTAFRNKMEDELLASYMVIYIEREFSDIIDPNMIINEFCDMGPRRASLKRNSNALVL